MSKISYKITPRDVLFFRDAKPMDVNKSRRDNIFNVGHGANWPRPDILFSAVMHELIRDPIAPEHEMYGKVPDLRVNGPLPILGEMLYLPMPLDWDMRLVAFNEEIGSTNVPKPLSAGFADRIVQKKDYPQWVSIADYRRYLNGEIGSGKKIGEADIPAKVNLYCVESRSGTTIDAATGASKRVDGKNDSGQFVAEYLRLEKGVSMICEIESQAADKIQKRNIRFGGQGGLARFESLGGSESLLARLETLPHGNRTRYVRWTLIAPGLFNKGWYPNWLEETAEGERTGKVMLPMEKVLKQPWESRADYRARMKAESHPFDTARLIAACIGKPVAYSGYDSEKKEKPTSLAVPAGSSYVFECASEEEAAKLVEVLNLKPLSDDGQKGFGYGLCSYVSAPEQFS